MEIGKVFSYQVGMSEVDRTFCHELKSNSWLLNPNNSHTISPRMKQHSIWSMEKMRKSIVKQERKRKTEGNGELQNSAALMHIHLQLVKAS